MFVVGTALVSDNLKKIRFVCDLDACKGACCVDGDSGAPLDIEEVHQIRENIDLIKPFMTPEGIATIERAGTFESDSDANLSTPLVDSRECAYTYLENGITRCAIEKAFVEGKIPFAKPVSCHLYPIRINCYGDFDAVNYHEWDICKPALLKGKHEKVPLYVFLKDSLIRKYGEVWYEELVDQIE